MSKTTLIIDWMYFRNIDYIDVLLLSVKHYVLRELKHNCYRVFSPDVTAAILMFQTSPVGVEPFSYVNAFFCSNKFA